MPGDESSSLDVAFYETLENRLARAGATLSRRLENGRGIWRLSLPRLDGDRLVLEEPGGPASPPASIGEVTAAFLRGDQPEAVLHLNVPGIEGVTMDDNALEQLSDEEAPADEPVGHLRAMLGRQYAQILRHDPGVRLDLHAEDVHQMRVAVRRARAVLRAARPVLDPEWSEPLRAELKWLGGSLGPRRDLDVLLARLRGQIAELEQPEQTAADALVESLDAEREAAHAAAVEALASDRYLRLLDALEAAARGPRVRRAEVSLRKLAAREFKRLRKMASQLGLESGDAELHRARILGKRARYAAELAEPEVGKAARTVVTRAKKFQDVLGAYQDAIVAEARLRGLLADTPGSGAAFAAGRLVEQERTRRVEARAALPKAWRALEQAGERAWA